jgi:hypothetical protein
MSRTTSCSLASRPTVLGVLLLGGALSLAAETESDRLTSRRQLPPSAEKAVEVGTEIRTAAGQRQRLLLPDGSVLYVNEKTTVKLAARQRLTLTSGEVFIEAADGAEPLVVQTTRRTVNGRSARFGVRVDDNGTAVLVSGGQIKAGDISLRAGQQLPATSDRPAAAARAAQQLDWTRELQATAQTPLVPGSSFTGGALIAIDPDGQEMKLTLRKYHIDVHVEDGFARTTIDQTYFNEEAQRLEGTFYFPLPPDASLSRLAMYVDGTLMEGGMAERDYARNVYEEIVYRQKDPALLEWVDGSTFKMRVFPLEARQEKRLILSYSQRLPAQYGAQTYRFPAGHSLGIVQDWSFHACVKDGADLTWNATGHNLKANTERSDLLLDATEKGVKLDRDVVVTLADKAAGDAERVRFSSAELDGAKYLMLRYRPALGGEVPPAARPRRDWVFLFESSGDRDPLLARTQIEVIRGLLAHAGPDDTFAVLSAGTRVHALAREAQPVTPANVAAAVAFLENVHLIGALDLEKALTETAPLLKTAKEPHLIQVGSGIAALGEQRTDKLVGLLPQGTRYIGIGVGRRWGRSFMKSAAEKTGGAFTQINPDEPVSWRTFELAASLDTPRLFNIQVKDNNRAALLSETTTIAQGEEVCALLRTDGELPESVTVTGTVGGKPFERTVPVKDVRANAGYLPRTWARLEIDRLLAANPAKHKDQIVALSKALYVMSPFTSLLVLENEEMYVRYKVDRGRKDHWALYPCPAKVPVVYEPLPGMPADARNLAKDQKPNARQVLNTIAGTTSKPQSLNSDSTDLALRIGGSAGLNSNYIGGAFTSDLAIPIVDSSFAYAGQYQIKLEPRGPQRLYKLDSVVARVSRDDLRARGRNVRLLGGDYNPQNRSPIGIWNGASESDIGLAGTIVPVNLPAAVMTLPEGHYLEHRPRNFPASPFPLSRELAAMADAPAPNRCMGELLNTSEDLRVLQDEWERIWFIDQQSHLTVDRVHGGITPGQGNLIPGQDSQQSGDDKRAAQEDRAFFDLVAYCPGMRPTWTDVQAVIDAEAAPDKASIPGRIDDGARKLIDRARSAGWQSVTFPARHGQPALTMRFDGQGRYTWERTLPPGLRERVVCGGQTILHIYPDLGIGARRPVGRAHRLALSSTVPWCVPSADDLARGADVKLLDERTVVLSAILPASGGRKSPGEGPDKSIQLRLLFAPDGALAERQLVEMPAGKILVRQILAADGTVKRLDADGKEKVVHKWQRAAADAPDLTTDTKDLVVLPLPYRTVEHVNERINKEKKDGVPLRRALALQLFAAELARGNAAGADKAFRDHFFNREQRQIGFYVLLAACGHNLDAEHGDVLAEHPADPLAQYLALYSSPVLRKHASQWAVSTGQWKDGYLQHLAITHALLQRWQNGKLLAAGAELRRVEIDKALDYARKHKGSAYAWRLLGLIQERAKEEEAAKRDARDLHQALVEAFAVFAELPSFRYAARYEQARSLFKAGQIAEARQKFRTLYEDTLKDGWLPAIDADFRQALLGDKDAWGVVIRQTADKLIADKRRAAVLVLARQCWQLGDEPLANHLLDAALDKLDDKTRLRITLASIGFLMETGQFARADQLLDGLLTAAQGDFHPALAGRTRAGLWRLGANLAERRDRKARQLECLEHALDAEYRNLPDVIDLSAVRKDYEKLLSHYESLAEAMVTLKVPPPADFRSRVVKVADRWRALDSDGSKASQAAARILRLLGDRELAWDYATTPIALQPGESTPWVSLAQTLGRQGELDLADRAFAAAFAAQPTDAQILWDRAQNLRQAGKQPEARKLLQQLAEGTWQPRFQALQAQARWHLSGN